MLKSCRFKLYIIQILYLYCWYYKIKQKLFAICAERPGRNIKYILWTKIIAHYMDTSLGLKITIASDFHYWYKLYNYKLNININNIYKYINIQL